MSPETKSEQRFENMVTILIPFLLISSWTRLETSWSKPRRT